MRKTKLAIAAALAATCVSSFAADRARVGLDDHRQRRPVQRLPLPRHLADATRSRRSRAASTPHVARLLRRQLELEHRQRLYNGANIEMDFYGGYKVPLGDFSSTSAPFTTTTRAAAPAARFKIDNTEIYIGGSYGRSA